MIPTRLVLTLSLTCIAAAASVRHAIAEDSMSPSRMKELDTLVGDGTCTGNIMATAKSPARATTGKYHGEKTLDGHWVVIRYDEDKSDSNPNPFHVQQYFNYDDEKKMFVAVEFDNMSPGYTSSTSSGWKGDTMTFDYNESVGGKTVSLRDVFTASASEKKHIGMMRNQKGEWVKIEEEVCKSR